ncbi:MAG: carboxypeptidase-like regulatory domain-containing protein, partial [Acidobacteriota bacterium]
MRRRFVIVLSLVLTLLSASAFSQDFKGGIIGEVTDSASAPIAGAKVTMTNLARNTATMTTTNSAGRFTVQSLPSGKYQLTIEHDGFKRFVREGIEINSADRIALNAALQIGDVTEIITVNDDAPLLQTETASRIALVENRALENIPTNGRNLYQLQYTLPGVIKNSTYWGSMELYAFGNVNGVSISGGRSGENETLIDGVSNTRPDRGVAYVPSLNGTQEFTLRSNTYDAR